MATLNEVMIDHILEVYKQCDGNKSQMARILGVDRRTLYRWIEKPELNSKVAEYETEQANQRAAEAGAAQ